MRAAAHQRDVLLEVHEVIAVLHGVDRLGLTFGCMVSTRKGWYLILHMYSCQAKVAPCHRI